MNSKNKKATKPVRKAIIPVAGLGTRFLPATKAQPKEMLPIVDKPVLQYLVEEAVSAGVEEVIFVTGKGKRAIEDHFDYMTELEDALDKKGKQEMIDMIRQISDMAHFTYVRQRQPRGDGDAILSAAHLVNDDEPVAILFGDDLVKHKKTCLAQMVEPYDKYDDPEIALEKIPRKDVSQYGIVDGKKLADRIYDVNRFVEKPKPEEAPSTLGVVGKYIITPEILSELRDSSSTASDGEIRLADAFVSYAQKDLLIGYQFEGQRLDCGSKLGFLQATVEYGLEHPETKKQFKKYLQNLEL